MQGASGQSEQFSHASWWQLGMVFVIALLVFISGRWQAEPWLRSQIAALAGQHGVTVEFQSLKLEGLALRFTGVSIRGPDMTSPAALQSLTVEPAWNAWIAGNLAARIGLNWQGQPATALAGVHDGYVELDDLDAALDVAVLKPVLHRQLGVPADVTGRVHLSGNIRFDAVTGQPASGKLTANWQGASAALAGVQIPLGDYRLVMQAEPPSPGSWQWRLSGGADITLNGEGKVQTPSGDPKAWTVNGQGRLDVVGKGVNPALSALMGGSAISFRLSGNVLSPGLQRI
jgi:hypothetical protein